MALVIKDRVRETTTTTGTGTITLGGAEASYQAFSVVGDGNTTYYAIVDSDAGDWEVGIGTYTASGTTLSRDTILESSNSGSAVNFGAGSKDVFVTYPAEKAIYEGSNVSLLTNNAGYLTSYTETDPVVGAITGIVKADGAGNISAAIAGTDYVATETYSSASDLLTAIKTVDGTGSGLDADTLDGNDSSAFYLATNPAGYTTNTGTVTSVAATVPTGLTVSGSPITSSGTLAISFDTGYAIPTTASQTNWDTAYGWGDHASAGYLTSYTETDPVVGAITGIVKADGAGNISAAVAGTDYLTSVQAGDIDSQTATDGYVLTADGAGGAAWEAVSGGGGGITYVVKTANYTASAGEGILADTSGGAFTITLPSSPSTGDQVIIADSGSAWNSNNLTVGRNGSTIEGSAADLTLDIEDALVELIYDGSTWQVFTQIGAGGLAHSENFNTASSSSGTATLDLSTGNVFSVTLTENISTFTWSNAPASGTAYGFTLKIVQDSTARTITWPAGVDWVAATAPTLSSGSGDVDIFAFFTHDGGTTWYGFTAGQDLS